MTNLLLSYPDIPFRAEGTLVSQTVDEDFPVANLISGRKSSQFRLAANQTTCDTRYDLGPSVTATADHIILGRADILANAVTDLEVQYGTNGSSWTSAATQTSVGAATRYGPYTQDFILTFTTTPARRWYQVRLNHAAGAKYQFSKLYLGKFLDFGKDPDEWEPGVIEPTRATWKAASGAEHHCRSTWPRFTARGVWRGLSDTVIQDFFNNVDRYSHRHNVFLYTATNHEMLLGYRLVYCAVTRAERVRDTFRDDWQSLSIEFVEVLE